MYATEEQRRMEFGVTKNHCFETCEEFFVCFVERSVKIIVCIVLVLCSTNNGVPEEAAAAVAAKFS